MTALPGSRRKVCVVTGTRADFGHLRWLCQAIAADPSMELQLVATGAHLLAGFGDTLDEVREAGLEVAASVEMPLATDSPREVTRSLGMGTMGFADALDRLSPDLLVVLGDRYEILAATQAALVAGIPVAHIHGGERSEGAMDESIRHAVTKMAHLHFVATEEYRTRVIQLGEDPSAVFNFGAPGLDGLSGLPRMSREELEARLGHPLVGRLAVATYHPATRGDQAPEASVEQLLEALRQADDLSVVFTGVNADPGARGIARRVAAFVDEAPARRSYHASLGQEGYLSLLAIADVCLGNSSSGLIEAPALGTPTVDVGPRQQGRVHGPTVIQVADEVDLIREALERALSPDFRAGWPADHSPYGGPGASVRIRDVLRDAPLDGLILKRFHDLHIPHAPSA